MLSRKFLNFVETCQEKENFPGKQLFQNLSLEPGASNLTISRPGIPYQY